MLVVLPVRVFIFRLCSVRQLVLRIDSCWVHQGGFFLPLGFPVGHATLKAVLHASVFDCAYE